MKQYYLRTRLLAIYLWLLVAGCFAQQPFGNGRLQVQSVARNAVRIQYVEGGQQTSDLPDWLYVKHNKVQSQNVEVRVDGKRQQIVIRDKGGRAVFTATGHHFHDGEATLAFATAKDEKGWFHIDIHGKALYSKRYLIVEPFYNGFALVTDFENNKQIINEKGEIVLCLS